MIVELLAVLLFVLVLAALAGVVARQRYMLRGPGSIPLALRRGANRWLYGVGQYAGEELRWFRAIGIGTRPSRVLRRGDVAVLNSRAPLAPELASMPVTAVVVEMRDSLGVVTMAFSEGAFTGFVSWLEASAPLF